MTRSFLAFILVILPSSVVLSQWPMSNDTTFDTRVNSPAYAIGKGPKIGLDAAHHNFFIQWDFIQPFFDLAKADGYVPIVGHSEFTPHYLDQFDILMIITALPFDFTTKNEVSNESTFSVEEINSLYDWVSRGGSLLVFSEHAPFDQAINPLLHKFGITSSIGYTTDTAHFDKKIGRTGWIEFSTENGTLNREHPIIQGRKPSERINKLLSFGGSGLSGEGYSNLLRLAESSENVMHATGVGPIDKGDSQGLAGTVGIGKIVAFGDANGFTAMLFDTEDRSKPADGIVQNYEAEHLAKQAAGMNLAAYDWRQFVLNTLHWLSAK